MSGDPTVTLPAWKSSETMIRSYLVNRVTPLFQLPGTLFYRIGQRMQW
jgi:hypothetical protein